MLNLFGQLLEKTELKNELFKHKKNNKKVVFTNGCFDLLHPGHVTYLAEAKSLGDILVIGLDSDSGVKKLKGEARPIQDQNARARVLSALRSVDYICFFDDGNPEPLIEALSPDILVKGGDWSLDQIRGAKFVLDNGGEVKSLAFVAGYSTTDIIEKSNK